MKLEQISYVIEIAETGSFSQAARNLFISQPNLSSSIKKLEEEMGFEIFKRKSSGAILTPEGRELLIHCQIIRQECLCLQKIRSSNEKIPGLLLRVASLNTHQISSVPVPVIKRYQGSPLNFVLTNYTDLDTLVRQVAACRFDFALLGIASPYVRSAKALFRKHDIEYHSIKQVPICAVVGPQSPLFGQTDPLPMETLFSHTIVSYGDISEDPSYCLPFSMGIENKVHGHIHVNSSQLFFQLVQKTASIGLIAANPEAACLPSEQVCILKLSDCPVDVELSWVKLRRVPLSSIASEFLDSYKNLC